MESFTDMTNLRFVGLCLGILGMITAFLYFRGPRWNRFNFVMGFVAALAIAVVSVQPSTVNW